MDPEQERTLIVASLEQALGADPELADAVFARFDGNDAQSARLLTHMDSHMRARMVGEAVQLVIDETADDDFDLLAYEVHAHDSYGVTRNAWALFLEALRDVVHAACGASWSHALEEAWTARIGAIEARVAACAPHERAVAR